MTTRSRRPLAGFGWLKRGISVSFRHPKPLFGGAAFLLLAAMLPTLITLPLQFGALYAGASLALATLGWITLGSVLVGLLLVPLYAGYLQVVDAAERGLPARARDIFKPYRQGEAWRLIVYGVAVVVIYIVLFGVVIVATGGGIVSWYGQLLTAQPGSHLMPAFPQGFAITMALFTVLGLLMMGFYSISLGQIALHRRKVFSAIGDGMVGALKNFLPLLALALSLIVVGIVMAIAFALVGILLSLLGKLVGAWFMIVLMIPLYIAMMLWMFTVMFGVMYHLWFDVCGDDNVGNPAPAIAA